MKIKCKFFLNNVNWKLKIDIQLKSQGNIERIRFTLKNYNGIIKNYDCYKLSEN